VRVFPTLLYHSIFDYPLTISEIHRYLISDRIVSLSALKKEISSLLQTGKILLRSGFFIPSSIIYHPSSIVVLRPRRQKISVRKLAIARRAAKAISIIPWIKMVAVTGALAMENADEDDDIDLMVVTSRNRLWIVRPLVLLFVSLFFKRRYPIPNAQTNNQKPTTNNAICLNLWLDESSLEIPIGQRDLYTAHELAQMKPVVNRDGTYEKMMWENRWGRKYLANAWDRPSGYQVGRLAGKKSLFFQIVNLLTCKPVNLFNRLAFNLQFRYMKPKMTNERVSLHSAFFHPGNRADTILKAYDRLCYRNF